MLVYYKMLEEIENEMLLKIIQYLDICSLIHLKMTNIFFQNMCTNKYFIKQYFLNRYEKFGYMMTTNTFEEEIFYIENYTKFLKNCNDVKTFNNSVICDRFGK